MPARRRTPGPLTLQEVADAIVHVQGLDLDGKLKCCDQIFVKQPAVLGAVVQLKSLGVNSVDQEHALFILLVLYECFTRHVPKLPRITETMVQAAIDNNFALLRLLDKETPEEARRLQRISIENYPEQPALAFVVGYLNEHGFVDYSPSNETVVRTCKSVLDVFMQAKQLAEGKRR